MRSHVLSSECKLLNTKECPQGQFDFLTLNFTTVLQYREHPLVRGINNFNSSYSSHNKFYTVKTTNHRLTTNRTKNECTHSPESSPQV